MSQSRVPPCLPEVTVERECLTIVGFSEIIAFFFSFNDLLLRWVYATISASETGPILLTIMSTSTIVGGPAD